MISNDLLHRFIGGQHIPYGDAMQLARELRDLRQEVYRAYNSANIENAITHISNAYNNMMPDD